jgi:hypothetical protein
LQGLGVGSSNDTLQNATTGGDDGMATRAMDFEAGENAASQGVEWMRLFEEKLRVEIYLIY